MINEEERRGLWTQLEPDDLVNNAIATAWRGKLPNPSIEGCRSATGESPVQYTSAARPRHSDLTPRQQQAIRALCRRIRNECRSDARKWRRRDKKHQLIVTNRFSDVERQILVRIYLLTAVEQLPAKRRRAFEEIEVKGRSVKSFAAENHISEDTVRAHLKHARRDLRKSLAG